MAQTKQTEKRKGEHVEIVLEKDTQYPYPAGFSQIAFEHCALPDFDLDKADTECLFLGRRLKLPFMVTGMTGGYSQAEKINADIAKACEEAGIAFGLGSQRAMIENPKLERTYISRKAAPDVFLCGNIGAYQLAQYERAGEFRKVEELVSRLDADALCIHLNPLQEAVQPEGDKNWFGVANAIAVACDRLPVPVIVKETGAGINGRVMRQLEGLGAKAVDVSGSGGTSWSAVELEREQKEIRLDEYRDWGIPTATALVECRRETRLPLIASGGIRSGLDVAKAIRLGATLGGAAYPFMAAQRAGGKAGVSALIQKWERSIKTAMFLTNSKDLTALSRARLLKPMQPPA